MMLSLLPLLVLGEQAEFAGLRKGQAAVCVVEWAGRGMAVCMWCVWECETLAMNKPERETDDAGSRVFACVVPEMAVDPLIKTSAVAPKHWTHSVFITHTH